MLSFADRIGLLYGFRWLAAEREFWWVLAICWAITPGMMILIAFVLEGRWLPLSPKKQFISFFPGDLFLGIGVAALLTAAQDLPDERRWYALPIFHAVVFILAAVVAVAMTASELKGEAYDEMAIISPTKLYHNGALYIGYGYAASVTLIAVLAGLGWREMLEGEWVTMGIVALAIWGLSVVFEGKFFGEDGMLEKAQHAHVANWRPIWVKP